MEKFTALVSWPSAPLTDSLVGKSLSALQPHPTIITSLSSALDSSKNRNNILQWSTYDAIDHDLTHSSSLNSKVLSSSYIIRKALIRKHFLSRCIHNYLTKRPDSVLRVAAPRTWELELSFADELDEMWSDDLWDLGEEMDKGDPQKWWILKPGMADRGMGLRLFHTKDDLQMIFEEFEQDDSDADDAEGEESSHDTTVVTSQLRHFVIQEYLPNPLLLDPAEVPLDGALKPQPEDLLGHKFHLRVYCVASGALTVYIYTRILALFSAVPYIPPAYEDTDINANLAAHLTNTSLQTERGEAGVRLLDELIGCLILPSPDAATQSAGAHQPKPPRTMGQAIDVDQIRIAGKESIEGLEQDTNHLSSADVEDLRTQIAEVLGETFKAAIEMSVHFQPLPNAFELYGVDFLVTHTPSPTSERKFQVKLLEVNSEPAIELTGPRLTWILEDLFRAIGKVCVAPFFCDPSLVPKEEEEKWEVGQTRDALRKCLELQVRAAGGW